MVKVFLTGVTGYIGGDAFVALYEAHPEYEYSLLVRNEERGKPVIDAYPQASNIRLVYGSDKDTSVLIREAAAADIVLHTADSSDNEVLAKALIQGVKEGHTPEHPGYYIHVSGTGILIWNDVESGRWGQPPLPEQTYNDLEGVDRILHGLPESAAHRGIDKIVLAANSDPADPSAVRTAIVCPPCIYGSGRGPVNRRSLQVPSLVHWLLTSRKHAPYVGEETIWDNVHVHDLSAIFVRLVETAAGALSATTADARAKTAASIYPDVFGPRAYYFVSNSEPHRWSDAARWAVQAAPTSLVDADASAKQFSIEEVTAAKGGHGDMTRLVNVTWGANSHGEAQRARRFLGWKPQAPSLKDSMAEAIAVEAGLLGLKA